MCLSEDVTYATKLQKENLRLADKERLVRDCIKVAQGQFSSTKIAYIKRDKQKPV
jgi:hypothetical protein